MTRLPLLPTLLVGLAVALMIALGIWQLDRRTQKLEALEQYRANLSLPVTDYPLDEPGEPRFLFRTLTAHCARVLDWTTIGGRMPDGSPGWRHIAFCSASAGGGRFAVDMGTSSDSRVRPQWQGGQVRGPASWAPAPGNALALLRGNAPPRRLMIVANQPAPGLAPSARPDPASIPNNHLAYAIQWFLFAGVAVVIYLLALRRRRADQGA